MEIFLIESPRFYIGALTPFTYKYAHKNKLSKHSELISYSFFPGSHSIRHLKASCAIGMRFRA